MVANTQVIVANSKISPNPMCCVSALAIPVATRLVSHAWLASIAHDNHHPNYGAMLMAYRALQASMLVAAFMLGAAVVLLLLSRRPRPI